MEIDKSRLVDTMGRPLTQGLFLEIGYNTEFAVYTLKDFDWTYEGVTYPSLKKLYLAHEDPVEYDFASTYLLGWSHWLRLYNKNQILRRHIDEWRTELELKLASQAVRDIIADTASDGSFQSKKYVAERQWNKNPVGRPKKDTSERDAKIEARLNDEFADDIKRLREAK